MATFRLEKIKGIFKCHFPPVDFGVDQILRKMFFVSFTFAIHVKEKRISVQEVCECFPRPSHRY